MCYTLRQLYGFIYLFVYIFWAFHLYWWDSNHEMGRESGEDMQQRSRTKPAATEDSSLHVQGARWAGDDR